MNEAQDRDNAAAAVYHHRGDNLPAHSRHDEEVLTEARVTAYWRANISLLLRLLAVWFTVSFGFGILLVDWLNRFTLFGFKLGFWWAQQGAIYAFIALIFAYVALIARVERRFGVDDAGGGDDP